jgi:hypothetical protein
VQGEKERALIVFAVLLKRETKKKWEKISMFVERVHCYVDPHTYSHADLFFFPSLNKISLIPKFCMRMHF